MLWKYLFNITTQWFNSSYAKDKALDLLKIVNLENRALHKPSALSGGEQQRIAIVRAISNSPEI